MLISFEICTDAIRAMLLNGREELLLGKLTFPRGTVQGGMISDMELVAKEIHNLLETEGVRERRCEFLLPTLSEGVKMKEVTLPWVKENKLLPLLRGQLAASVPDIERHVVDYIEFDPEEEEGRTMLAVLAPVKLIEQYVKLSAKLNLKCMEIQLRFARLRQRAMPLITEPACIVLDLAEDEIEICLFEDEKIFVRVMPVEEQDTTLADWGITFAAAGPGLAEQAGTLAEKINALIQFQASRNRDIPVSALYAVGDFLRYGGMLSAAAERLGREILPLLPEQAADWGREAPQEEAALEEAPQGGAPQEEAPQDGTAGTGVQA